MQVSIARRAATNRCRSCTVAGSEEGPWSSDSKCVQQDRAPHRLDGQQLREHCLAVLGELIGDSRGGDKALIGIAQRPLPRETNQFQTILQDHRIVGREETPTDTPVAGFRDSQRLRIIDSRRDSACCTVETEVGGRERVTQRERIVASIRSASVVSSRITV